MRQGAPMAEQVFFELVAEEQKEILQTVFPQLALSASVLEKDVWVCWTSGSTKSESNQSDSDMHQI